MDLGNEPPNAAENADSSPKVHPPVPQAIAVTLTLALFGAGFSALGFGGPQVEQGAGLLAILLFCCLLPFGGNMHILRIAAVPLVVFSLCLGALAGVGNAFAFFLAGCGSLSGSFSCSVLDPAARAAPHYDPSPCACCISVPQPAPA